MERLAPTFSNQALPWFFPRKVFYQKPPLKNINLLIVLTVNFYQALKVPFKRDF